MSGIFSAFQVTASALTAQRLRMDVTANNIANSETTRTDEGGPYQRQQVFFVAQQPDNHNFRLTVSHRNLPQVGQGVEVSQILTDDTPGNRVYDPNHPDANEEGYVTYPNVNIITEMTNMLSATRSYEANVTVFNALKGMAAKALDIGNK